MIFGPLRPYSSSLRGGKDIAVSGEKLWVILGLATLSHAFLGNWFVHPSEGFLNKDVFSGRGLSAATSPWWVIPCINPEFSCNSGAPSTSRTFAFLYLSIKVSVDLRLFVDVMYLPPDPYIALFDEIVFPETLSFRIFIAIDRLLLVACQPTLAFAVTALS
ncbi:hypothetical protein Tco_0773442 [Tanacetum coccineum]|uniref:Uncharacterized protein n=1 Tax=Tanacetum coccineum TaxID=301880 RepID=A0ABQ4ZN08_9ASTR